MWSNSAFKEELEDKEISNFYSRDWFNSDYRTYRSFFWKVVINLISKYYETETCSGIWSKKMVYSNLYKIAPDDLNPNYFQKEIQLNLSIELIKKEIEELNPKFCIVLSNNSWWSPFRDSLKSSRLSGWGYLSEIVSVEQYGETKIIVTPDLTVAITKNMLNKF